jgi:hypothetical protein
MTLVVNNDSYQRIAEGRRSDQFLLLSPAEICLEIGRHYLLANLETLGPATRKCLG